MLVDDGSSDDQPNDDAVNKRLDALEEKLDQ